MARKGKKPSVEACSTDRAQHFIDRCSCPVCITLERRYYKTWAEVSAYYSKFFFIQTFNAFHPLGRNGQPQDVVAAILFLVSEEAAWITGATLAVDRGVTEIVIDVSGLKRVV
jgi:NAD(P)-dependent dehydrogenase (short-subunit alcohol dehydrogenase family)